MFKTKKLPLTKREKMTNCIIIMIAILSVMVVWLADLTFEFVGAKIYPITEVEVIEWVEVDTREWVLNEVEKAGIDKYKVYNLITCESEWETQAHYVNYDEHRSVDRGLWMLNSYWHSEVSPICAYEYQCATREAIRIIQERGFGEWTCGK